MDLQAVYIDATVAVEYGLRGHEGKYALLKGRIVIEICASLKDAKEVINARRQRGKF